jgi:DNA invertase Pin-like site-specific DNA recombinase
VLIVWKLDRLGPSLPHLIETVTALEKWRVGFRSITEAIDTTTPVAGWCSTFSEHLEVRA